MSTATATKTKKTATAASGKKTAAVKKTAPPAAQAKAGTAPENAEPEQISHLDIVSDPTLVYRDPMNAREDEFAAPGRELLASVAAIGVQEPVHVRPDGNGRYTVFKGDLRTQAQIVANGHAAIDTEAKAKAEGRKVRQPRKLKAIIHHGLAGSAHDAEVYLLSFIENKHRTNPSADAELKAYDRLLEITDSKKLDEFGRTLGLTKRGLRAAKKAQKLDQRALREAHGVGYNLEQMADLAEVSDVAGAERRLHDAHEKDLTEGKGGSGHWEHAMAALRQKAQNDAAKKATLRELRESGQLLTAPYSYGERPKYRRLADLTTALGDEMTEQRHRECPGHKAGVDDEGNKVWHCEDPKKYKHLVRPEAQEPKRKKTEAELEEGRKVRACNAAWRAAKVPREKAVQGIVRASGKLPDEVAQYAIATAVNMRSFFTRYLERRSTADVMRLMGKQVSGAEVLAEVAPGQVSKGREMHWLFALVSLAQEHAMREPKSWAHLHVQQAEWLLLLERYGYTLSDVERKAVERHRPKTPDQESPAPESEQQQTEPETGASAGADSAPRAGAEQAAEQESAAAA
ncbi:hypothetical protein [Streptomyces nanshensis]|uniref:ParB/Sulfiredoxin domain-containing protein n=1 Tax=Streptomyces nanshensis TaxID=518642 RepID=A0A1E7L4I2_9ACTN|nr:hypothetical protein [Streptomyces nanshensis]OEV10923.1 hypothetical protein AN218_15405 [Streptomyces nanshensis]